jgi:hypothetical protein
LAKLDNKSNFNEIVNPSGCKLSNRMVGRRDPKSLKEQCTIKITAVIFTTGFFGSPAADRKTNGRKTVKATSVFNET